MVVIVNIEFTTECRFYYHLLPLTKSQLAVGTNVCWGQIMNDEEIFEHSTTLICGYIGGCFWSQSQMDSPHTPLPLKRAERNHNKLSHTFFFLIDRKILTS